MHDPKTRSSVAAGPTVTDSHRQSPTVTDSHRHLPTAADSRRPGVDQTSSEPSLRNRRLPPGFAGMGYHAQAAALSPLQCDNGGGHLAPAGPGYARQAAALSPLSREAAESGGPTAQGIAAQGLTGTGGALPYMDRIQASFGRFDVSGIRAHTDGQAAAATQAPVSGYDTHVAALAPCRDGQPCSDDDSPLFTSAERKEVIALTRGHLNMTHGTYIKQTAKAVAIIRKVKKRKSWVAQLATDAVATFALTPGVGGLIAKMVNELPVKSPNTIYRAALWTQKNSDGLAKQTVTWTRQHAALVADDQLGKIEDFLDKQARSRLSELSARLPSMTDQQIAAAFGMYHDKVTTPEILRAAIIKEMQTAQSLLDITDKPLLEGALTHAIWVMFRGRKTLWRAKTLRGAGQYELERPIDPRHHPLALGLQADTHGQVSRCQPRPLPYPARRQRLLTGATVYEVSTEKMGAMKGCP